MTFSVFLVEDDLRLQKLIGDAINSVCDARVVGTSDTETHAINWLNNNTHDWQLAVLDIFLKTGTGFGVLEGLLPQASRGKVIVLTNSATTGTRNRCLALGALAVYDKTRELGAFLDHCLRHHQQHQI